MSCDILALPGNHDDPDELLAQWRGRPLSPMRYYQWQDWRLVLLDSTAPGLPDGFLARSDFNFLEQYIAKDEHQSVLIFMHHHPILVGAQYVDDYAMINRSAFLEKLADYPQVKGVFFGHVHQVFEQEVKGITFYSAPSTCMQFQPHVAEFAIDHTLTPGYRWIELHEEGFFQTGVIYIPQNS